MRQLLRRLWYFLKQRRLETDLAEEIACHRAMKQRDLEGRGVHARDATVAVRRALGSVALAQDRSRDLWCPHWLQGIGQDLKLAVRALVATPLVSFIAVLSLALGIGANTAIFSLVNGLLLRPLPVAHPERLVTLSTGPADTQQIYSYRTFEEIRQRSRGFDGALAWSGSLLAVSDETQTVYNQWVSGDFFTTLGVQPLLGRTITPADDVAGGGPDGPVAVISYQFWQRHFDGQTNAIGSSLTVERVPVTIVGVTPPAFQGVEPGWAFDLAIPIKTGSLIRPATPLDVDSPWLRIMLRLTPEQSLASATAVLRAVQPQIRAAAMPQTYTATDFLNEPFLLTQGVATTGVTDPRAQYQRALLTLLAVVALVLLTACGNIANLQLGRGAARQHELSVRLALGASRWRLTRPLLMESVVLAAVGTMLGFVAATWTARLLMAQLSTPMARLAIDLPLDWRVLTFTIGAMIATVLLAGVAPAARATQVTPVGALNTLGRGVAGETRVYLSSGVMVAQIAVSLLLVAAAGLFVRSFASLARVSPGFDRDRVLVVTVTAPTVPAADRNPVYHRLVRAAAAVPGVAHAGGSLNPPLIGFLSGDFVVSAPGVAPPANAERISQSNEITPGWLAAYGTVIREGRDIDDRDTTSSQPVILVNEAFVRRFLPGRRPLGTTLAVTVRVPPNGDFPMGSKTIVGVVGDAVYRSVREAPRPMLYFPLAQQDFPIRQTYFYVGVQSQAVSPVLLARPVTAALKAINPDLTLTFSSLADQVDDALAQDRLIAWLSGFFGTLALLLSGLGLYGVTAYAVARRRAEIGVRMAVGSTPAGILRLVLARVAMLVGIGVLLGAPISLLVSRFVASLLYGVEPRDPATFIGAAVVLAAVAGLAGGLPAWRASRVDPALVLRDQ